eukprot:1157301-Pelagomonas_calceolata.AAC.6
MEIQPSTPMGIKPKAQLHACLPRATVSSRKFESEQLVEMKCNGAESEQLVQIIGQPFLRLRALPATIKHEGIGGPLRTMCAQLSGAGTHAITPLREQLQS